MKVVINRKAPDIAALIQSIVNRSDWSSCNYLTITINSDAQVQRVAVSFDKDASKAANLQIQYRSTEQGEVCAVPVIGPMTTEPTTTEPTTTEPTTTEPTTTEPVSTEPVVINPKSADIQGLT